MATLEQQVEDFIGEDVAGDDIIYTTDMLDQWLNDAANYIISRMPFKLLHLFSAESAEKTSDGYAFEGAIAGVLREHDSDDNGSGDTWIPADPIHNSFRIQAAALATATRPKYYVANGLVYVLPTPGADPNAFKVLECVQNAIDASSDSTISNFPNVLEPAVVIYGAMAIKLREMAYVRRIAQDKFEAIKVDYSGDVGIQAKLTAAWDVLQNSKPTATTDAYNVLGVDEDPVRARVTLELAKRAMEIGLAEAGFYNKDDENNLKAMEGLFAQGNKALQEYRDLKTEFETKIQAFVGGKIASPEIIAQ